MNPQIDTARLDEVRAIALQSGGHTAIGEGMCVMEAVSYVAGEPWSDAPACACPVIGAFMRSWNDSLPDDKRTELLRPLITRLVGSKSTPEVEGRRATMACDWLVRMYTPAWLRLAGLTAQADALAGLPEITDFANTPSIKPAIEAARRDAAAAWAAARAAARAAAEDAAEAAARAAAGDAAGDAAGAAAWAAARAAARDAARAAAWAAAGDAAGAAAKAKLAPIVTELQASALQLVERMLSAEVA
ncbi:hypothetical protein CS053_08620 [Rhodanobacter glycinis]|uniref:Uncharacterized protein n=1 Tax=Rhodanobacter glycinis TaxID=582702 RepID=A0A5B9E213_9GAMM|nr:hypothetical protein [Rhodanobacter glycinis]QEE24560.1 hypothetical protein CS053_08620 [Rhodanobacter glycinis]